MTLVLSMLKCAPSFSVLCDPTASTGDATAEMLAIVGGALCIFLGRCSGVTGFKSTSEDRFCLGNSADPDEKAYEPRHVIYNNVAF